VDSEVNKCSVDNVSVMMNLKSFILAMGAVVVIAFAALLGVQVSAQQQTMPTDPHHLDNNNSNQSGSNITEQQQQNTTTTLSGQVMMNQTFTTNWISLVSGVKVTGISVIDTDHIAINLRYDGEGGPPGVSVVAVVAIKNSSSGAIIGSMMQQDSIMMRQQGEMTKDMIMASNQQSNSSTDQESSQQHNQQHAQNSTSATNNSVRIMQSGSNYLEAGWQGQESNSAAVLVQLDGDIPEGGQIMVMVFPFLHR
jgi:hypothetical protein